MTLTQMGRYRYRPNHYVGGDRTQVSRTPMVQAANPTHTTTLSSFPKMELRSSPSAV